ncbi:hypothetical protein VitviT2T_000738 [Vitis vinifera]|uniref:BHLH domain-containing protein n=2 Tax=Vitis vinifera TaxID=29760 RepID=A0ABY9BDE6_VITVI|nr:transcription factor bHLH168 [Vitis vinifera]RVX10404.1 Transcription factor bHLH168 [Vitis vinifera]WJZ80863.1 hypothetical protein VitviT2T_000738 [Vitis vinifera]|eukprot:XP_010653707.2 PREDICTED: transcription factor bHLH55-like isoform X1 [Vitis vinifera]
MPRGNNLPKLDRNALERNRRMYMKDLFSKLAYLIPIQPGPRSSLHALLNQAIAHVKELQERIEMLKQRRQLLEGTHHDAAGISGSMSPVVSLRDLGFILELCLITGLNENFTLHQVINVLLEEAAEVVDVSYSTVGHRIFYTIYFRAVCSRIGIETSRLHERLKELIF